MFLKKRFRVTFLLDNSNLWLEKYLKKFNFRLKKKFIFKFAINQNKVINQDIVFPIGYTKILKKKFLKKNFYKKKKFTFVLTLNLMEL